MSQPRLRRVVDGWAAIGEGWAVRGKTEEEAIARFREAEMKHSEIDARPFAYQKPTTDQSEEVEANGQKWVLPVRSNA